MAYLHHQYWPLSLTIPAKTPVASPVSASWAIVQGTMAGIKTVIPAGGKGTVGMKITYQGTQIIPWSLSAWYINDGATDTWAWGEEMMATGLTLWGYNTDVNPHTIYAYADVTPVLADPPASFGPADAGGGLAAGLVTAIGGLSG